MSAHAKIQAMVQARQAMADVLARIGITDPATQSKWTGWGTYRVTAMVPIEEPPMPGAVDVFAQIQAICHPGWEKPMVCAVAYHRAEVLDGMDIYQGMDTDRFNTQGGKGWMSPRTLAKMLVPVLKKPA